MGGRFKDLFSCPMCRCEAKVEECIFNSCAWSIEYEVQKASGGCFGQKVGPRVASQTGEDCARVWKKEHPYYMHLEVTVKHALAESRLCDWTLHKPAHSRLRTELFLLFRIATCACSF